MLKLTDEQWLKVLKVGQQILSNEYRCADTIFASSTKSSLPARHLNRNSRSYDGSRTTDAPWPSLATASTILQRLNGRMSELRLPVAPRSPWKVRAHGNRQTRGQS